MILLRNFFLVFFLAFIFNSCNANNMAEGFADLHDIDPSIKVFVDAHTSMNFIGRPIKGYYANKIIVSKKLGLALKKVQHELKSKGFSLLVYDAYRPQMAVDDFVEWGKDLNDQKMKKYLYPNIEKAQIFAKGFVAKRSSHSRGGAVDLTIIALDKPLKEGEFVERKLPTGRIIPYFDDGSVDMGSSAGLFDEVSWTDNKDVSLEGQKNRKFLKEVMTKHRFKNYAKEWWHYNLINEPFPNTYFNFPIE
jgi:D-alanyl-D-alanine dipeptidase